MMPLVIPAALLLLLGASTLLSRTIRNYLASTKQSDAQLARDVAESGMNKVLSILNPMAKHSSDPYVSYLLASRWVPGSGTTYTTGVSGEEVRSGWRLTSLPRASVRDLLSRCGLADRGQHPNQLPPINEDGYRNILSGSIGPANATTNIQLRYIVTNYVPPERVASQLPWPTECDDFTTLSGGSGQISVEGRVIRNGRILSTYTLTRSIDVQGWPLPILPAGWLDNSAVALPGPPVSLRIAGTSTNLGDVEMRYYLNPSTDLSTCFNGSCEYRVSLMQCQGFCPNGQPFRGSTTSALQLETRVPISDVIPANDTDLPRYPFNTDLPPAGLTPLQINESRSNYPYNPTTNRLYDECRESSQADANYPRQFRPNEIDCWIESIGVPGKISNFSYQALPKPQITVSLGSNERFDVRAGTAIVVTNVSGWPNGNQIKGTVVSASGPTITFTPTPEDKDPPLPSNDLTLPQSITAGNCSLSTSNGSQTAPPPCIYPSGPLRIRVNTQFRPVNLIIRKDIGTLETNNFVSIKHKAQGDNDYVHDNSQLSVRPLWNRLRIFGGQRTAATCPAPNAQPRPQTFHIDPNPGSLLGDASLGGAFLWLPRGSLVYGPPGASRGTYPQELLSVWWICNLDISGLTTGFSNNNLTSSRPFLRFVSPLLGNQDAVSSLLTGGYFTAAGVFTTDERFPVYPSLMRIRSAF